MDAHLVADYLKYHISRPHRNGHGIHSPFLYELLTHVVFPKNNKPSAEIKKIEALRNSLLKNKQCIHILDLGAGSSKIKTDLRRIDRIARYCTSNSHEGRLIHRLTQYLKPATILELGSCLGIGTLYLASGNPNALTYTLEGSPILAQLSNQHFTKLNYPSIHLLTGDFSSQIPKVVESTGTLDLVYVDGNHTGEATMTYFSSLLPYMHSQSVILFDDIRWSASMKKAWEQIYAHPEVTLSLDLFQMGIIFFNKNLQKEHFTIYY